MTNGYLNWRSVWDPATSPELWEWRHYAATYDEQVAAMRKVQAQEATQRA